jgi:hypothetical protein
MLLETPQQLYRFAEADDSADDIAAPTVDRPQLGRSPETAAYLARNWKFEPRRQTVHRSSSITCRGVCELTSPRRRTRASTAKRDLDHALTIRPPGPSVIRPAPAVSSLRHDPPGVIEALVVAVLKELEGVVRHSTYRTHVELFAGFPIYRSIFGGGSLSYGR